MAEAGATEMKDMGKVMGMLGQTARVKADMGKVSALVHLKS